MMLHLNLLEAPPDGRVGLVAHSGAEGGVAVSATSVHIVRSVGERLTTLTNKIGESTKVIVTPPQIFVWVQ